MFNQSQSLFFFLLTSVAVGFARWGLYWGQFTKAEVCQCRISVSVELFKHLLQLLVSHYVK